MNEQFFDLLQRGLVNVCCVGDIVHSDERFDWVINDNGDWTHELLEKEMLRSLGSAAMIMYLKMQYPEHFHCLRGNHDDMAGELTKDFRKFVGLQFKDDECVTIDGSPVVTSDKGESTIVRPLGQFDCHPRAYIQKGRKQRGYHCNLRKSRNQRLCETVVLWAYSRLC